MMASRSFRASTRQLDVHCKKEQQTREGLILRGNRSFTIDDQIGQMSFDVRGPNRFKVSQAF